MRARAGSEGQEEGWGLTGAQVEEQDYDVDFSLMQRFPPFSIT